MLVALGQPRIALIGILEERNLPEDEVVLYVEIG